jgi:hypothetical protein
MNTRWLGRLLGRVHRSEDGAVSLETVLILGAIALPILIFLIRYGWPTVRSYFERGMTDLMAGSDAAKDSGTTTTDTTGTTTGGDPAATTPTTEVP